MRELGWALGKDVLEKANVHASEYSWVGSEFDFVIENDGTVDDLFNGIKQVLSKSQEQDHLDAIPDLL
jgi:triacylglycerol esterase/lipase EstA (alpha/beta hydrolase family)